MAYIPNHIESIEENVTKLTYPGGKSLYLVGTAHVSEASATQVSKIIEENKPQTVCLELDAGRYKNIAESGNFDNLDIVKILKTGQGFFFIGYLLMATWQKKISDKTGSKPGQEFRNAIEEAKKIDAEIVLADRDIGVTLKRTWRKLTFMNKIKLLGSVFFGEETQVDEEDIESIKKEDALKPLIEEFAKELPEIKRVLIDERDEYLASKITGGVKNSKGNCIVAVVGAGHVPGMLERMKKGAEGDTAPLEVIPPSDIFLKILPWILPLVILGLFINGFINGNMEELKEGAIHWILVTGSLGALGAIIALAHPLVILLAFVAAPITALHPTLGVGMFTALAQAALIKPRVIDFINLQENAANPKGWYKNRLTRVLLAFILPSLGTSIGTITFLPWLRNLL